MNKIDNIYYINLDRRPDRNTHFLNQCQQHGLPFSKIQRFKAVDGSTFNFSDKIYEMFARCDYFRTLKFYRENNMDEKRYKVAERLAKCIMGNQLSHYYILLEMKQKNYDYIIIFQDDVTFKKGFINYIDEIINIYIYIFIYINKYINIYIYKF